MASGFSSYQFARWIGAIVRKSAPQTRPPKNSFDTRPSPATSPHIWSAVLMQDGQDGRTVTLRHEIDRVRKPAEQATPNRGLDYRKLKRVTANSLQDMVKFGNEPRAKPLPLLLIPEGGRLNVILSLIGDVWVDTHQPDRDRSLRRRAYRTSDHGRPARADFRCASRRSRITCRCQSGTGTSSGSAATRSQRVWRYSIRSSTGRSSKPGGGNGTFIAMAPF